MNYRQTPPLATELRLIVECCRWNFGADGEEAVRALSTKADWDALLRLARRHRVQGLVRHCLRDLEISLPAAHAATLGAESDAIVARNLRAFAASERLAAAFGHAGVDLLLVKGLTVAALAYRKPFVKMSWDLDILIEPSTVSQAARLLAELGYVPVLPAGAIARWHEHSKESQWVAPDGDMLELHTRLADNPAMIPAITTRTARQQVEVLPGRSLPTLAPEPLFAYLCVHGASSNWFRLKWIADLAGLLHGRSDQDIAHLHAASQDLGAGRAAAQGLLLARRLFGTASGSALLDQLTREPKNRFMLRSAMADLGSPGEPTERRFGTARIHLLQLLLQPGFRFKAGEIRRQMLSALRNLR